MDYARYYEYVEIIKRFGGFLNLVSESNYLSFVYYVLVSVVSV